MSQTHSEGQAVQTHSEGQAVQTHSEGQEVIQKDSQLMIYLDHPLFSCFKSDDNPSTKHCMLNVVLNIRSSPL